MENSARNSERAIIHTALLVPMTLWFDDTSREPRRDAATPRDTAGSRSISAGVARVLAGRHWTQCHQPHPALANETESAHDSHCQLPQPGMRDIVYTCRRYHFEYCAVPPQPPNKVHQSARLSLGVATKPVTLASTAAFDHPAACASSTHPPLFATTTKVASMPG